MVEITPADLPALDAFLNSAMREERLLNARILNGQLRFLDSSGRTVSVGLHATSSLRFLCDGRITRSQNGQARAISTKTLLSELSADGGPTFQSRVLDSLAAIRAAPHSQGRASDWSFIDAEQALKAGHPFHPNPRSRDEMTTADARIYAPEQENRFRLTWIAARPDALVLSDDAAALFGQLAQADHITADDGFIPLPWHPWQGERLLASPDMQRLISNDQLRPLGKGGGDWAATSSMRCVHAWHVPFMVKTSLSLRLTNSTRHLSLKEVKRGLHVSDLLASDIGHQIRTAFPTLHIMGEPGFAALRGPSGEPMEETVTVLRDNPFRDPDRPGPVLLAALCEAQPNGYSALGALITAIGPDAAPTWFSRFLDNVIWPLLELRARHGLLFGAHQQNLMVGLSDGWPVAAWVRDCQGTGHLSSFHDSLTHACPGIGEGTENIVDAELGDGLVVYYVVINSVMNTLATLVLDGLATEADLLTIWRSFLTRARNTTPGDDTLYTRLLDRRTLTCKGNFATSQSGVNEADGDARGQLAAFFELPNPIKEALIA
ncbi:N2-citryl-N6-acetyl-N6-hydroxylysine synthase [Yoonia maricola]|uniref:N2-citryl-N6-acetyl-N6-hydroxylysine synthase n=1 Tax=Yoonia maricola TaxID=420999 RepID=A0A2M8W038_9RHOB|nr:IucA/IucC family protein [Yoonia maricola]PJI84286.1 N2-citryl-N6-acetyl-N6-hydroxylysine synthase [Yoonia maricola]